MTSPQEHVDLIISAAFGHWEVPGQNVCIFTPKRNANFLSIQSIVIELATRSRHCRSPVTVPSEFADLSSSSHESRRNTC